MKLSVIALDYDGTIAQRDALDPEVRTAIADARTRGILVIRILDNLRRVAGDLHFVDGVVAENGAVVHFPGSGHTWLAGLLAEQLILHGYAMCVLDPEGDYRSLEELPGVAVLGGEEPPPTPRELLRALRYPDRSVVIDLSHMSHDGKIDYVRAALPALNVMRRRNGLPHRILLDEAHYFLFEAGARHLLDLDANGYTMVTYCASRLPPELVAATEVMLVTCESNPAEIDALCKRCAGCQAVDEARARWSVLAHLSLGQAIVLPITDEAGGELKMFNIGQRLTPHVRHRQKYVDVPVPEARAFEFAANGGPGVRARTLRQFVAAVEHASPTALAPYVRRGDFSRWIADVFGDRALADDLRRYEQRFTTSGGGDALADLTGAIRARYDLLEDETEAI